jgi:glutathione S-transferase
MIQLYQFAPAFGLPNASPFCMKLETYLRMAGLPFEIPRFKLQQLQGAPKGKMPYITDGSRTVSDSSLIIDYLKSTYGDPLDSWMNAEQRAVALAWQRLLEEHYYWVGVYTRWVEPAGWALMRPTFFAGMPAPLSWIIPALARRGMVKELHGHGMGRHSREEIYALGCGDLTALADFLGDKPYLMGEQPCALDAVAYGFLANLLWVPLESPLKQHAKTYPQLERFCERMRARYYAP